jgi:hypothetical protein
MLAQVETTARTQACRSSGAFSILERAAADSQLRAGTQSSKSTDGRASSDVSHYCCDANHGYHSFTESFSGHRSIVCEAEPLRSDKRRFNNKGLFGIIVKAHVPTWQ